MDIRRDTLAHSRTQEVTHGFQKAIARWKAHIILYFDLWQVKEKKKAIGALEMHFRILQR